MGAENSSNAGKTFWNVVDGKFAVRVKEGTENAVTRTNKNGKVVHELHYDTLSGMTITSIKKVTNDNYGDSWEIGLSEIGDHFVLNLPYSGRVTNGLFFRLPNVSLKAPVTLKVFKIEVKENPGTFRQFLTVEQGGQKVEPAFTKDAPNGLPQLEKVVFKGKEAWDDTKQMAFIENMLNTTIIPKLSEGAPKLSGHVVGNEEPSIDQPDIDDEETPF